MSPLLKLFKEASYFCGRCYSKNKKNWFIIRWFKIFRAPGSTLTFLRPWGWNSPKPTRRLWGRGMFRRWCLTRLPFICPSQPSGATSQEFYNLIKVLITVINKNKIISNKILLSNTLMLLMIDMVVNWIEFNDVTNIYEATSEHL